MPRGDPSAIVSQRVGELIERGLLAEDGLGVSSGGRAPRVVRFLADAGHLLVADLGATSIDVAVTDLSGVILGHAQEPCDIAAGPAPVLGQVEELFEQALRAAGPIPGELGAIGIGLPGPVEFVSGRPIAPPIMPGWDRYSVRERFASYDVPIWVDNDVNLMALGELRAGIARGYDNVVFIKIGTGIGAGIVVQGKLHRGAEGGAGDVGHIQVVETESDVVCRFDQNVALQARDVGHAAMHGDAVSVELITNAGHLIGRTLAGIVNFFNPSLIVIGGGVAQVGDLLLATVRESVYRRSLPLATRHLQVQRSTLEGLGGVIGAAVMVTDELFAPQRLRHWLDAGTPVGRPSPVGPT